MKGQSKSKSKEVYWSTLTFEHITLYIRLSKIHMSKTHTYIYGNKLTGNTACMMTSSNGNVFRVTGHLCGEFTGPRWFPPHKGQWRGALMWVFYLRLNKRLSKQSWGWWFETLLSRLWRHRNGNAFFETCVSTKEKEARGLVDHQRRTRNRMKYSDGFPLWY